MYRVVVIDDENIVRKGIRDLVNWEDIGLEIVGDAEDGQSGLTLIQEKVPDIILLDINMPKLNGIELSKMIRTNYPKIKIVMISGYDEFNYVREALRLGIEDYILKPVTRVELEGLLRKLVHKLDEEKELSFQSEKVKQQTKQFLVMMRQNTLEDLIEGQIEEDLLLKRCIKLDLSYDKKYYGVALIDIDEFLNGVRENNREVTFFAVKNIIDELISREKDGYAFEIEGFNALLYFSNEIEEVYEIYYKRLVQIKQTIYQTLGITITIGVGELVERLIDIKNSYRIAHEALMNRFFLGGNRIITSESTQIGFSISNQNEWLEWEERLMKVLGEPLHVRSILDEIEEHMKRMKLHKEACQNIWSLLASGILKRFMQLDETLITIFTDTVNVVQEIKDKKTSKEIKEWLYSIYLKCNNDIQREVDPCKAYVNQIIQFIDKNYQLPDLSIPMICNEIHISPSYLSMIFKKEMGLSFIQYITQYRLEKARYLLRYTSLKTYEIAEQVGYEDAQYFSTLFKKQIHMTPSQYKKTQVKETYEKV